MPDGRRSAAVMDLRPRPPLAGLAVRLAAAISPYRGGPRAKRCAITEPHKSGSNTQAPVVHPRVGTTADGPPHPWGAVLRLAAVGAVVAMRRATRSPPRA